MADGEGVQLTLARTEVLRQMQQGLHLSRSVDWTGDRLTADAGGGEASLVSTTSIRPRVRRSDMGVSLACHDRRAEDGDRETARTSNKRGMSWPT